nr:ARF guanine-nucleotide exchange factor GNL2 [Ipomoea batatas]
MLNTEVGAVLAVLRRSSDGGHYFAAEECYDTPISQSLKSLRALIFNPQQEWRNLDPSLYLLPFLDVIQNDEAPAAATGLALSSVFKILKLEIFDHKTPGVREAINSSVAAITSCRLEKTDPVSEDAVMMKILQVLTGDNGTALASIWLTIQAGVHGRRTRASKVVATSRASRGDLLQRHSARSRCMSWCTIVSRGCGGGVTDWENSAVGHWRTARWTIPGDGDQGGGDIFHFLCSLFDWTTFVPPPNSLRICAPRRPRLYPVICSTVFEHRYQLASGRSRFGASTGKAFFLNSCYFKVAGATNTLGPFPRNGQWRPDKLSAGSPTFRGGSLRQLRLAIATFRTVFEGHRKAPMQARNTLQAELLTSFAAPILRRPIHHHPQHRRATIDRRRQHPRDPTASRLHAWRIPEIQRVLEAFAGDSMSSNLLESFYSKDAVFYPVLFCDYAQHGSANPQVNPFLPMQSSLIPAGTPQGNERPNQWIQLKSTDPSKNTITLSANDMTSRMAIWSVFTIANNFKNFIRVRMEDDRDCLLKLKKLKLLPQQSVVEPEAKTRHESWEISQFLSMDNVEESSKHGCERIPRTTYKSVRPVPHRQHFSAQVHLCPEDTVQKSRAFPHILLAARGKAEIQALQLEEEETVGLNKPPEELNLQILNLMWKLEKEISWTHALMFIVHSVTHKSLEEYPALSKPSWAGISEDLGFTPSNIVTASSLVIFAMVDRPAREDAGYLKLDLREPGFQGVLDGGVEEDGYLKMVSTMKEKEILGADRKMMI